MFQQKKRGRKLYTFRRHDRSPCTQRQPEILSADEDQVNSDREDRRQKADQKSHQAAQGKRRSNLGKHARGSSQSTLNDSTKPVKIAPSEQSTIDMAFLLLFIMCNVSSGVADSLGFNQMFQFLRPGCTTFTVVNRRRAVWATDTTRLALFVHPGCWPTGLRIGLYCRRRWDDPVPSLPLPGVASFWLMCAAYCTAYKM